MGKETLNNTELGNCNSIHITFKLKDSLEAIETMVHDGERPFKAEEAFAKGLAKREDVEKADSSHYDALRPMVDRYFEACHKNRQFRKST